MRCAVTIHSIRKASTQKELAVFWLPFLWKRVSVALASQAVDRMKEFRCCLADSDCPGVSLEETEAADCTDGWEREWTVVRFACVVTHWSDC
jgi:hypothetical protein